MGIAARRTLGPVVCEEVTTSTERECLKSFVVILALFLISLSPVSEGNKKRTYRVCPLLCNTKIPLKAWCVAAW